MSYSWRQLVTWDSAPGTAMALDEALLIQGGERPVLRLYTWQPATLSLGYFQKLAEVPAAARATALVRRLTGGGAIHHACELTFSIAAPLAHPLYRGPAAESYARVHALIAAACARLGAHCTLRGAARLESDQPRTGMCFHHSSALDLVVDARKLVGSAQRRSASRVLHHGSIKLGPDPWEPGVAQLAACAGRPVSPEELGELLVLEFEGAFGTRFEPEPPTDAEQDHCEARAAFFTSREHIARR